MAATRSDQGTSATVAESATILVEYPERYDAKQITVAPDDDDGLRIREVVDIDFGTEQRHGYERVIPDGRQRSRRQRT